MKEALKKEGILKDQEPLYERGNTRPQTRTRGLGNRDDDERKLNGIPIDPDKNYLPRDAHKYLGHKSKKALEKWRFLKKGPRYLKIGGRIFYPGSELIAYMDNQLCSTDDMPAT